MSLNSIFVKKSVALEKLKEKSLQPFIVTNHTKDASGVQKGSGL